MEISLRDKESGMERRRVEAEWKAWKDDGEMKLWMNCQQSLNWKEPGGRSLLEKNIELYHC